MKQITFFLNILFLCTSSLYSQTTEGREFWLTFGNNRNLTYPYVDLRIRIVSGNMPTTGTIYFTDLGSSRSFNIPAHHVYTYLLTNAEKQAVYNQTMGVSNRSIHVVSDEHPITVYALNIIVASADATNILPVAALNNNYYQISYMPTDNFQDAYAVVSTSDNNRVYHNGTPVATLNTGEVYYRTSATDMTGTHVTSDHPVAFFALNQGAHIPANCGYSDCLMQQLPPVNTWGKNFFVPVSHLTKDIIRIVASQDNTNITQIGGTLLFSEGGETSLTHLQAGQFVELEVSLSNNGCYIRSDKPVGVCAYLTGVNYNNLGESDPSQSWLAPIEQTVSTAVIAPFMYSGYFAHALLVTSTATKLETKVSIGNAPPADLSGSSWVDNADAGISFYSMPMTDDTVSYFFSNTNGFFIMGYGTGSAESYYYLAAGGMRDLTCAFYANNIQYQELDAHLFCERDILFCAEIDDAGMEIDSICWFINGIEEQTAQNQKTWSKTITEGNYIITMKVKTSTGEMKMIDGMLHIGAIVTTVQMPPDEGTTSGDGCYKVGEIITISAIPNENYYFIKWTENDEEVSINPDYTFMVSHDKNLVAHFAKTLYFNVNITVNDEEYGYATGEGIYPVNDTISVRAYVNDCYQFLNWRVNDIEVSKDAQYSFVITGNVDLVAHFTALEFDSVAHILWNNTIMLNLKKLREKYNLTGCKWFKNGVEELDTRTINEFSYSAGTSASDLLELAPTWYMFQLITEDSDLVCSTKKSITTYHPSKFLVYPNPVVSQAPLIIEGVSKGCLVNVYNLFGVCVKSVIADNSIIQLSLDLPQGFYFIRANNCEAKVVVIK